MTLWTSLASTARWLPAPSFLTRPPLGSHPHVTSTSSNVENCPKNIPGNLYQHSSVPHMAYSVTEVLSVAKIHPFYSKARYPPDEEAIRAAREKIESSSTKVDLEKQPLLKKKHLYAVIERLVNDTSPENTYRHNVYTSVTGGGSTNSRPLFFATDANENRRHRANFGQLLQTLSLVKKGDWVLTTHCAGDLYRSLDLTCEIMENAGASVLAAGNHLTPSRTVQLLQDFNVNVLMGDGSQVLSVVHEISTMTTGRSKIKLDKIIYTSEGLTAGQKSHVHRVLGPVEICSILGSAEAGPYGVSSPSLIPSDPTANYSDFIIDTRMTLIEILPLSFPAGDIPSPLPEGETGVIAQTSLTRLRNPVVRYLTGDVGSLHPLTEHALSLIPETHQSYMRVLRLQGRDQRFSFMWDGYDIEFEKLNIVMAEPVLEILQWQAILDEMEPSKEISIELRVFSSCSERKEVIVNRLEEFFWIYSSNKHKFRVTFVDDVAEFELSKTGRKVIKFVDRRN